MPVPAGGYTPPASLPAWAPTLAQVAAYVPHRTLARSAASTVNSDDRYLFTFDDTTIPAGTQVSGLIADGVAWVAGRVGALNPGLADMATVVAALYAAAAVERGWPDDEQALQRANDIEKRMDALLATLAGANSATSGTGTYGVTAAAPVYSFPPADLRWDYPGYW